MKILLTLSGFLLLAPVARSQSNALMQGVVYFKQQQYKAALREFQKAHSVQPKDAVIENLIGVTETKLGDLDDANRDYRRAIALDPSAVNPYKNLGVNYLTTKQYDISGKELLKAEALAPRDQFVHYYLATLYLDTGRDADAVQQLEYAKSLIENDPQMLLQMASACVRLNMKEESAALIEKLEAGGSLNVSQEYRLGVLLTAHHMYAQALKRFQLIVRMEPASFADQFNLAIAFINAGRLQPAVQVLQSLTSQYPDEPKIFSVLGSLYEATGNDSKALSAYSTAVRLDPSNADRYLTYTRLLMNLDRYEEATKVLDQGMKHTPDDYALNLRLGAIDMAEGQLTRARAAFQKAVDENPEIPLGYYAVAQCYMREGKDMEASQLLSKAQDKLGPSSMLEYLYGLTLVHMSKTQEAIAAFQKSIALNPKAAASHYELGILYSRAGDLQLARSEFERVLAIAPGSIKSRYQLSRIYHRLGQTGKAQAMAVQIQQLLKQRSEADLKIQKARILGYQSLPALKN